MTGRVFVELDGVLVPLDKCEWVWTDKCGCPIAVAHADTADEETAWKDVWHLARERARRRRRGITAELMTFARAKEEYLPKMRSEYQCPHTGKEEEK